MTMLASVLGASSALIPNPWNDWVEFIMRPSKTYRLQRAAVVFQEGATAASTSGFSISESDIKRLQKYFDDPSEANASTIKLQGKTYVLKRADDKQIVAFNGNKYLIISRAKKMYVIAVCKSRTRHSSAAEWVGLFADNLEEKGF